MQYSVQYRLHGQCYHYIRKYFKAGVLNLGYAYPQGYVRSILGILNRFIKILWFLSNCLYVVESGLHVLGWICPPPETGHLSDNFNKEALRVMSLERKLSWTTFATQPCKPIIQWLPLLVFY